jgi:hypothetical protein
MGRHPIPGQNALGVLPAEGGHFCNEIKWRVKSPSFPGLCTGTFPDNHATTALQPKRPELLRELFGQMHYTPPHQEWHRQSFALAVSSKPSQPGHGVGRGNTFFLSIQAHYNFLQENFKHINSGDKTPLQF